MLKGVAHLFRDRDISKSASSRYLDGLAVVSDPTAGVLEVERITGRQQVTPTRTAKAFNPLSRDDLQALYRSAGLSFDRTGASPAGRPNRISEGPLPPSLLTSLTWSHP